MIKYGRIQTIRVEDILICLDVLTLNGKDISRRLRHGWRDHTRIADGTLYPLLDRMEHHGFVTSYRANQERYFTRTPMGEQFLKDRDDTRKRLRLMTQVDHLEIFCPRCSGQHVDRGEWETKHHRTHLCEHCGHRFRPKDKLTVGIDTTLDAA